MTRIAPIAGAALLLASCGAGNEPDVQRAPQFAATSSATTGTSAAAYEELVQRIYVAYFGRPADPAGLAFWAEQYRGAGAPTSVAELSLAYDRNPGFRMFVDVFGTSQESQDLYPGDNRAFITAIYQNLFNRAPDDAGLAYWAGLIDAGALTRPIAALAIMGGALGSDSSIIANKVSVARSFSTSLDTPERTASYSGMSANQVVRSMLGTVGLDTDVISFSTTINLTIVNLVEAAQPQPAGFKLSSGMTGNGKGTIDPAGGTYAKGAIVTVKAEPDFYSDFRGWTGRSGCAGGLGGCRLTMEQDYFMEARFERTRFATSFDTTYTAVRGGAKNCTFTLRWTNTRIDFELDAAYEMTMRVRGTFQPSSADPNCNSNPASFDKSFPVASYSKNGFTHSVQLQGGAVAGEYMTVSVMSLPGPQAGVNLFAPIGITLEYKGSEALSGRSELFQTLTRNPVP
ncbi:MAG TPA: DUF4214 domain-containing protein [Telluria sp.]